MIYVQLVISGLINGALYALLALGIVLIYRTSRVLNLAHGALATLTTYIYWQLTDPWGLPLAVAWVATLLFAAALGATINKVLVTPLASASLLAKIIMTLGMLMFIMAFVPIVWGPETKQIRSGFSLSTFQVGDLFISWEQVAAFVMTAVLSIALFLLIRHTKLGVEIRAVSYSTTLAQLMGVRVGPVTGTAWAIGIVLAAIAGIMLTPFAFLAPLTLTLFLTKALAAALFGGLESLPLAVVGGLVIGVGEALVPVWFPQPGAPDVFNFVVIVGLLLLRAPEMLERDVGTVAP